MSETPNVVQAVSKVMAELPAIGKDGRAAANQGGYAYRGIEQITGHVQRLFAAHGVVMAPRVTSHEVIEITVNNKPWSDTRLEVSYDVYGPGGVEDRITVGPIYAIGRDNSDKGANKAMTQAYKYALLQLLCISDSADDGDQASVQADHHPEPARPSGPVASDPSTWPDPAPAKLAKLALVDAVGDDKDDGKRLWAILCERTGQDPETAEDVNADALREVVETAATLLADEPFQEASG